MNFKNDLQIATGFTAEISPFKKNLFYLLKFHTLFYNFLQEI